MVICDMFDGSEETVTMSAEMLRANLRQAWLQGLEEASRSVESSEHKNVQSVVDARRIRDLKTR